MWYGDTTEREREREKERHSRESTRARANREEGDIFGGLSEFLYLWTEIVVIFRLAQPVEPIRLFPSFREIFAFTALP
jgi:hypothetical protein